MAQVAKDVREFMAGTFALDIPVNKVVRVYPVVIAIDRRVRTPPLSFWFEQRFNSELGQSVDKSRLGAVAVWALEDLETIEQLVRNGSASLQGTPRGPLRLLSMWHQRRNRLTATRKRAAAWHHFIESETDAPSENSRLRAESERWMSEIKGLFKDTEA